MDTQPLQPSTSPMESYLPAVELLLGEILRTGGFELQAQIRRTETDEEDLEAPEVIVELSGPDADLLLEKGAALLNALEYVVLKAVRLEEDLFPRITFDCQGCRRLRVEELRLMAEVAAERVLDTGEPFQFRPMSSRERRIIHIALKDQPAVRTVSEGTGPERKVVIHPSSSPERGGRPL